MSMARVEYVYDKDDNLLGRIEIESGFGVTAHRARDKATFTFLTHGYRAVIGPSDDYSGVNTNTIKAHARVFIRS